MAAKRAASANMTALQIFTAIPKYYGDKISIKPERVERFRSTLADTKIKLENVVVHAAYVLSVATPDDDKYARAAVESTSMKDRTPLDSEVSGGIDARARIVTREPGERLCHRPGIERRHS